MLSFVKQAAIEGKAPKCLTIENPVKAFKWIFVDSLIVGGVVFAATWNGEADISSCLSALKAFGIAFFGQLFYERGIKKKE